MAITVTQHKTGHSVVSALTVGITMTSTAAGKLLAVGCASALNHTVASVTDNIGNTYTQATGAAANANSNADRSDVWYCLSASAGVTTITITYNGTAGTFAKDGTAWEVSGFTTCVFDVAKAANDINQTNGIDDPGTNGTVTTTSTTGFIVAEIKTDPGGIIAANPRAGNEFTSGGDIATGTLSAGCSLISTTATTHKPIWDDGNSFLNFCCSVVAFKEAPAAGDTQEWRGCYPIQRAPSPTVMY